MNSENDVDGWSLIDVLNDLPNVLTKEKGWNQTFNPIVYTLYGIFNKMEWEEIPFISEEPENATVIKNIAYVNMKKLPGTSLANHSEVQKHFSENDILKRQIELFKPQVIICGGTFDLLDNLFEEIYGDEYDKMEERKENKTRIFHNSRLMIIDTYHPSNRSLGKEVYCNTIINSVLNFMN